jgi:hypothetical protein
MIAQGQEVQLARCGVWQPLTCTTALRAPGTVWYWCDTILRAHITFIKLIRCLNFRGSR